MMDEAKEFFEAEVKFNPVTMATVAAEHPDLVNKTWDLRSTFAGLIGGACLMLTVAYGNHAKVTPIEASALELRQAQDSQRVAAQDLDGLFSDTRTMLDKLRQGHPTGTEGLRAETKRRFGLGSVATNVTDTEAMAASVRFIVRDS